MTENQKEWLKSLYMDAIDEAHYAADNERVWAEGSPDEETAAMHFANMEEQLQYVKVLEDLCDAID